jgi:hypothetical protein
MNEITTALCGVVDYDELNDFYTNFNNVIFYLFRKLLIKLKKTIRNLENDWPNLENFRMT